MIEATRTTGIRLEDKHFKKLQDLVKATGANSRNQVLAQLIENARLVEPTTIKYDVVTTIEAIHAS